MGIKPEYLDKWIAALRSGQFGQGHGLLQDIDGDGYASNAYCCLGVLDTAALGADYEREAMVLDDMETSRTTQSCGLLGSCQDILAHINDKWNYTFGQIADMLDAERESLINLGTFPRDWWEDHKEWVECHGCPVEVALAIRDLEREESANT